MSESPISQQSSSKPASVTRSIAVRNQGIQHGAITRLLSPGDLGEMIKPFVFLDYFELRADTMPGFHPHPHSGIATHTTFLAGGMSYGDSTGRSGSVSTQAIEWMQAGGGVWHWGKPNAGIVSRGYQLWIALPPELELAPAKSQLIEMQQVDTDGTVRILLGEYGTLRSPIQVALPITYLNVRLNDGEVWQYAPLAEHDVAWLAVHRGRLHGAGATLEDELAIFGEGNAPIEVRAEGHAEFVIGSAEKHRYRSFADPHPCIRAKRRLDAVFLISKSWRPAPR